MLRKTSLFALLAVFAVLISTVSASAWSPLDHEIFKLNDQVTRDLGAKTSFYNWLEVSPKATAEEIHKAYKRISRRIHPDKVARFGSKKEYKEATERFTRLGLINQILRNTESKERYDFFLEHGFPRWKGGDYFYSRYRPGLGFVLVFLFLLIGTGQYVAKRITASQHRKHMSMVISDAKAAAWPGGLPESGKRKVGFPNGKIFMVYTDGTVCLVEDNQEFPLDLAEIEDPTWKDTIIYTLPLRLYEKVFPPKDSGNTSRAKSTETKASSENEEKPKAKPKPAVKTAGGRRRK